MRGIVVGDVLRRLVGRTMAQQLSKAVEAATSPHQYALSTRAGTECVAHVLQGLTEMDPQTTIVSIDGVGAYDSISRKAMLEASTTFIRERVENRGTPSCPSSSHWVNTRALEAVRARLINGERLFAFLDDRVRHDHAKPGGSGSQHCAGRVAPAFPESTSTLARLKSGTPLEFGHQRVTNWSGSHS